MKKENCNIIKITSKKLNKPKSQKSMEYKNKAKIPNTYKKIGKIEPIYKGETIYIIGGGPSLKGFNWTKLISKRTIAVNKAFLFYPGADVLYWTDVRFYDWYEKEINEFKGLKVTNKNRPVRDDVINLLDTGRLGLDTNPSNIRHGSNSGYAAINLAVHLGAKTIVLLGFDMRMTGQRSHWHDGYTTPQNPTVYAQAMIPAFDTLVEPLRNLKIEVYNACPTSALNTFKKCSIDLSLTL